MRHRGASRTKCFHYSQSINLLPLTRSIVTKNRAYYLPCVPTGQIPSSLFNELPLMKRLNYGALLSISIQLACKPLHIVIGVCHQRYATGHLLLSTDRVFVDAVVLLNLFDSYVRPRPRKVYIFLPCYLHGRHIFLLSILANEWLKELFQYWFHL